MPSKLWFVTGCSTGLGRAFATAILGTGDRVIATARDVTTIEGLRQAGAICLQLDITTTEQKLAEQLAQIESKHGPVDILINNASYTQTGAVEEVSAEAMMGQFDTSFFGTVNMTKAVLPHFRRRRAGTLVMVTSRFAHRGQAGFGPYSASKHTLRGLTECLREDVRPFGIRVVEIAPGLSRTAAQTHRDTRTVSSDVSEYQAVTEKVNSFIELNNGLAPGDPSKIAERTVQLVTREKELGGREAPEFLPTGNIPWTLLREGYSKKLEILDKYKNAICSTDFD